MAQKAQAVTDLYALLPEAFTAARNQRAGEAAKAGDKELGKSIRSLPKPSAGAWLVNMLALHRPELMSEALALGAALREAQADMDQQQLRQLSGERQRLLRSAAREARSLAEDLGRPVSPAVAAEVEQTLWAAMTDADAAAAAASGQLVRTLEANGWEPVTLDGALADPDSVKPLAPGQLRGPAPGKAPPGKGASEKAASAAGQEKKRAETARALRAARTTLADAQRDAAGAEEALQRAQAEVDSIADTRDELTDEIDELRERIRGLEREVAAVDRRAGTAERARDTARRTARAARRAVERAQAKVEDLG
ncbi:hypothetical protein J2M53_16220 [Arthrobacter sp. zg-ZUI100]|uniref:hypothetical protein n=1 Tax=Arthrobacter jiangjiafuii TaxID=2817475 RepID=UPI001AED637E|nr:hypothetical protein [Arthrobacter jiangjiafuii]MBP3037786.1 hypothetical protein [Arthrobacter jiangjiafuii]